MRRIKTSVCEKLTAFNLKSKATENFIKSNANIQRYVNIFVY